MEYLQFILDWFKGLTDTQVGVIVASIITLLTMIAACLYSPKSSDFYKFSGRDADYDEFTLYGGDEDK